MIRYPEHIDNIINYNYVMYQNENYSNKWFYAFITNMKYVNDNMTEITIKTDVFQTWQFDLIYKKMFVEREHVNDDIVGLHTVPENLETGEYINQPDYEGELFTYLNNTYICIAVSDRVIDSAGLPHIYNGLYSGLEYLLFQNEQNATAYINYVNSKSKADAIYSMFIIPANIVSNVEWLTYQEDGSSLFNYAFCPNSNTVSLIDNVRYTIPNFLDQNYIPKNKKLLTYPYRCFNISNNSGQTFTYRYEDFDTSNTNGKCDFTLYGSIDCGCSMKLIPHYYKRELKNHIEGIDAGKLPTISWITDPYVNWLTQNGVNLAIKTTLGLGGVALGVASTLATGGATLPVLIGASAGISGASSIASAVQEVREHYIQPEQANGGANQGNYNFCNKLTFTIQRVSIKQEYAKIIDDYFSMYGYKVNSVKIPNITGRTNWNYIKTINANILGNIPQEDLQEIKNMFDNGITFWHNPNTFFQERRQI